ncbi:MAG: hypothetical protein DKINENOH_02112 [bacterium]|nr:hypothetical protein [bacterium]
MRFEEEYQDILQNIEATTIEVYRELPELMDYDVADAVQLLAGQYVAEETKRFPPYANISERANRVLQAAKAVCEWRLGRNPLVSSEGEEVPAPQNSLSEIIACLKRIHKSVQYWTKQGGRQGYLKFVSQFL